MQRTATESAEHPRETNDPNKLGLRYLHGFGAVISGRNWLGTIGLVGVGVLVPVVGPIAIEGYRFDAIESFIRGRARSFPPVELNRFGEYLIRGLWVSLPMLILQFVIGPIMAVFIQAAVFGVIVLVAALTSSGTVSPQDIASLVSIGVAALFVVITVATLFTKLLLTPIQLRAGLTQDFAKSLDLGWIKDFLKRVWLEMLIAEIFFFLSTIALIPFGLLIFFVGVYFVTALSILAHTHLLGQLYRLYLLRGGTPIPMKEPSLDAIENWQAADAEPTNQAA